MDKLSNPTEDRKVKRGILFFGSFICLFIGLAVIIFFVSIVSKSHSLPNNGQILNLTNFGAFGDFIAGAAGTLFSLAGFFLLYLTLNDQRENFHKERLESNFFEMIRFHRENVNELQFTYYETQEKNSRTTAEKRKVFKLIFTQFKGAWKEIDHIFQERDINSIYEFNYLEKLKNNPQVVKRKIDLKQFAQIDIIYQIIFFGLGKEDKQTILNLCKDRYKIEFVSYALDFAALKPKHESRYWWSWETIKTFNGFTQIFNDILSRRRNKLYAVEEKEYLTPQGIKSFSDFFYNDDYEKYYGGHQFRLGHYYRHFYQSVKFIDKEKYLTDKEKYDYVKILRGQLSNYEQLVFFLNSLSEIGRTWELAKKGQPSKNIRKEKQLITKYNLITNIPTRYVCESIDLLDYYPEVEYETIVDRDKVDN